MLAQHDADLIRQDKEIPGLGLLLDTARFVPTIEKHLRDVKLGTADTTYVKYRPGKYCRVGYTFSIGGVRVPISATAYARKLHHEVQRATTQDGIPGSFGKGRLVLEEDLVVVSVFPNDHNLAALTSLSDVESVWVLLIRLGLVATDTRPVSIELIRYRPERRCVAEVSSECGFRAILKFYSEEEYSVACRNSVALQSGDLLRIPRRLGYLDHERIVALEHLPGQLLFDRLLDSSVDGEILSNVAAALAELHAQGSDRLEPRKRESEVAHALAVADFVSFLCPRLAPRVHRVADDLCRRFVREPFELSAIHGDFSPRQVLLDSDRVGFVDLDNAGLGNPTEDLGSFLSRLELDSIRGFIDQRLVEPMGQTLVDAYASATGRRVGGSVALFTAFALFRLISHPFRKREPAWPDRMAAMLDRIECLLQTDRAHAVRAR
jgi:Ser/Thr protein kinase RdoA (MazF antagonist)